MRFVVDCGVVLHLASEGIEVRDEHELLAPTLLRSQTLSALHAAVHRGELAPDVALDRLDRIWAMQIRLLGDAVLRRKAWRLAEQLGWAETYDAEYIALHATPGRCIRHSGCPALARVEAIVTTATMRRAPVRLTARARRAGPIALRAPGFGVPARLPSLGELARPGAHSPGRARDARLVRRAQPSSASSSPSFPPRSRSILVSVTAISLTSASSTVDLWVNDPSGALVTMRNIAGGLC